MRDVGKILQAAEQDMRMPTIKQTKTTGEQLEIEWEIRNGSPTITSITLSSAEGVGREALEQVAVGAHRHVDLQAASILNRVFQTTDDESAELGRRLTSARKRRTWTTDELANVADLYRQAVADGQPPREAIAETYYISKAMASKVIRMARDHGLLEEATKGDK